MFLALQYRTVLYCTLLYCAGLYYTETRFLFFFVGDTGAGMVDTSTRVLSSSRKMSDKVCQLKDGFECVRIFYCRCVLCCCLCLCLFVYLFIFYC